MIDFVFSISQTIILHDGSKAIQLSCLQGTFAVGKMGLVSTAPHQFKYVKLTGGQSVSCGCEPWHQCITQVMNAAFT